MQKGEGGCKIHKKGGGGLELKNLGGEACFGDGGGRGQK